MNFRTFVILLSTSALTVTGCASTATGKKQSVMASGVTSQSLKNTPPKGSLLAVVRYPAVVDVDAQEAYRKAYVDAAIGGKVSSSQADSVEAENMADSAIVKSNYFALSLYKELVARLPGHSVLLSPHSVKLGPDGSLTSEPITQAESLPSAVTIDFATYSFPDPSKMMDSQPLTFGDLITPLVTVRTDHRAAAPTQGLLMASRPLTAHAAGNSHKIAMSGMSEIQAGQFDNTAPELDFISYLAKGDVKVLPTQGLTMGERSHAVQTLPVEKLQMDRSALTSLDDGQKGTVDPLRDVFSKNFANRIIDIINETPIEKASMMKRAAAISEFDPNLAALTFVGGSESDYQSRFNYVERLLEAQQKYLSVQSLRLFDGVHNGEMGAQVRDMLKAEYGILERRRELARKQNTATAMAILGAVAAGASMSNTDPSSGYGQRILNEMLVNAAIYSGTQAFAYRNESRAVGDNYLTSIVPALEEQTSVQVDLIDSNETITAIRFEDLKEKLQTLYTDNQRSLDRVATRCAYTHTGTARTGTWLGECNGGLGSGTGVGVIKNADGTSAEYYGYASNGQPNGPGYLVVHDVSGSYSLEGNFSGGQANGVMLVSKPGREDSLREYRSGSDVGAASSGSKFISPFNAGAAKLAVGTAG